ncbi:MAG: PAS domain S-box protein, partial [Planctomycetales bacterium]
MVVLLTLSIAIQFAAAALAISLIRLTGRWQAWTCVAAATVFMGLRRCITLYRITWGDELLLIDPVAESIALGISLLMLVGVAWIRPLFSDMKKVQQNFAENDKQLRLLLAQLPTILWTVDREPRLTCLMGSRLAELDLNPDARVGKPWGEVFGRRHLDELRRAISGEKADFDAQWFGRRFEVHMEPFRNPQGNIVGAVGVAHDVTERIEAERAVLKAESELEQRVEERTAHLEQVNERLMQQIVERGPTEASRVSRFIYLLEATIESAPTAMVMIDPGGKILLANAEMEKLFEYTREELLGSPIEILLPERFRKGHPSKRDSFFAEPEARSMGKDRELFALRKSGAEFPVEIRLNPVMSEEGMFVISAVVDVTERKRAEGELRSLNETLEHRVTEQTRTLRAAMEKLTEVKNAAVSASQAKSAFLANMSHEIRTPLNAIIGMAELVLDTQLRIEQREYLQMVRDSSELLLTIINDVLDFSKIEAGRLDFELAPFNHAELLGDTMKSLGLRAHRKGLELVCRIAPETPAVLIGDSGRLRQVLINLVGNAIKFTEQGEIQVEVAVDQEQENNSLRLR